MNGLNFVAIDFETAAGPRDTACSVSMVRVRDSEIVDHYSTLINPECDFSFFNTSIHHITPDMVMDAPTFPDIAQVICDFIGNDVLVAHNAPFDTDVLNKMFLRYDLPVPKYEYLCTVQASKAAFPDLANYKLITLCNALHIPLEHHHDAYCDTCACANLLIAVAQSVGASSIDDLIEKLSIKTNVIASKPVKKSHIYAQRTAEEWGIILAEQERERAKKEAEIEAQRQEREKQRAQRQAEQAAKKAALLAEREARRLEREKKRAQREAEKAAAAKRRSAIRSVMQCTDDGTIVQIFANVAQAASVMGIDNKCIRDAANGKQKHAGGYCWVWCESTRDGEDMTMLNSNFLSEADMLLDALKASKPDKAFTFEYIPMKDGRTISFKVAGGILFYLVSTRQGSYIKTDSSKALFQLCPDAQPLANEYMKIPVDQHFDMEGFCRIMGPRCEELFDDSATMHFGCCNDFNLCSDMKKCPYLEIPDRRGCYYRKNLEAGRIFYGKNKTI